MRVLIVPALFFSMFGLAGCGDAEPAEQTPGAAGFGATSAGGRSGNGTGGGTAGDAPAAGTGGSAAGAGGTMVAAGSDAGGAAGSAGMGGTPTPLSWPEFCKELATAPMGEQWQTERVFYEDGKLTYAADADQNRIPDYSYAGYRYGQEPLPEVAEAERSRMPLPSYALAVIPPLLRDRRCLYGASPNQPNLIRGPRRSPR